MQPGSRDRPRFFWQATLVVLPVIVLTSIALLLLRQERASIEQEARSQAASISAQISARVGAQLNSELARFLEDCSRYWLQELGRLGVRVNTGGRTPLAGSQNDLPWCECLVAGPRYLLPPEYSRQPLPANWPYQLPVAQQALWERTEDALFRTRNPQAAGPLLRRLLGYSLPDTVRANVQWNLLLLAHNDGQPDSPVPSQMIDLAERYPDALSPAGVPIADLALHRSIVAARAAPLSDNDTARLLRELARRSSFTPSVLTSRLLDEAADSGSALGPAAADAVKRLREVWSARELSLDLLKKSGAGYEGEGDWVMSGSQLFVIVSAPLENDEIRYAGLLPFAAWAAVWNNSLDQTGVSIPDYLNLEIRAGDRWMAVGRVPGILVPPQESSAAALSSISFQPQLRPSEAFFQMLGQAGQAKALTRRPERLFPRPVAVRLVLARPDVLYAQYRRRAWLAAGFILAAATAAFLGLAGTWRAFRQQRRLAEIQSGFVSSVSHELRAPIASVRLLAESLESGRIAEAPKRAEYYRLIVQECRRLSSLIENALDFSRIGRGRKTYEFEPTDLRRLMEQTIRLMQPAAEQAGVELTLTIPDATSAVLIPCLDGQAVEQAVVNLVDNAIKHTPAEKQVQVVYSLSGDSKGRGRLTISVGDEGVGIPADEHERIFEPFYRRESELRPEGRGVGIGLSIVKHAAEAHGGRVVVDSAPGKGSRFTLQLAVKVLEEEPEADEKLGKQDGRKNLDRGR